MEDDDDLELNAHVSDEHSLSNGLSIRILREYNITWQRPQLVIVINEDTTKQNLYDGFGEVEPIRDRLIAQFGSNLSSSVDYVLLNAYQMHEQGLGYGKIAKILNYRSLALVCCAYHSKEGFEDNDNRWGLGTTSLYFMFTGFRLSEEQCKEQLRVAYEQLDIGIVPWKLEDGPFNTARIKNNLGYFYDRIQRGKIIFGPKTRPFSADLLVDARLLKDGWYDKANQLLQKDAVYWKKRRQWIAERLDSVKQELSNIESPLLGEYKEWLKNGGKV